jgi:hypothetical protein
MSYKFVGKKGKMYEFETKLNASGEEIYHGECSAKIFGENIRRLMHTGKYDIDQAVAITFSECEREGKAHAETEADLIRTEKEKKKKKN